MKKWKIVKICTTVFLILFIIRLIIDAIMCMKMTYPHPMLGIDANNWTDQFFCRYSIYFSNMGCTFNN